MKLQPRLIYSIRVLNVNVESRSYVTVFRYIYNTKYSIYCILYIYKSSREHNTFKMHKYIYFWQANIKFIRP